MGSMIIIISMILKERVFTAKLQAQYGGGLSRGINLAIPHTVNFHTFAGQLVIPTP